MASLETFYQQVILDHAREKHGRGLAGDGVESHQYNPLCGDEVTLRLQLAPGVPTAAAPAGPPPEGETAHPTGVTVVHNLTWDGEGCSISQAATSVLHDLVLGRPVDEARSIVADYRQMLRSRGGTEPDEAVLGDAVAFAGVGRHANRVKCAMLGWTAFEEALLLSGSGGSDRGPADPGEVNEREGR